MDFILSSSGRRQGTGVFCVYSILDLTKTYFIIFLGGKENEKGIIKKTVMLGLGLVISCRLGRMLKPEGRQEG